MGFTPEVVEQIKYLLEEGERISAKAESMGETFCFKSPLSRQHSVLQTPNSRIEIGRPKKQEFPVRSINYTLRPNTDCLTEDRRCIFISVSNLLVLHHPNQDRYSMLAATGIFKFDLTEGAYGLIPGTLDLNMPLIKQNMRMLGSAEPATNLTDEVAIPILEPFVEAIKSGIIVPITRYEIGLPNRDSEIEKYEKYPILP